MRLRLAAFIFGAALAPSHDHVEIGSSLVCSAVPDPPEGGAGGADKDKGGKLSQETIDAINATVAARLSRIDFSPQITAAVTAALPKLQEGLVAALKPADDAGAGGDDKGGKGKGGKGKEDDNETAALRARLAKLEADNAEKDAAMARATQAAKDKAHADAFGAAVAAVGVKEKLRSGAVAVMRGGAKIVEGDDGQPMVEVKRTQFGSTYTEKITVADYAKEWAKSDEGKEYMPPPQGRSANNMRAAGAGGQGAAGAGAGQGAQNGQAGGQAGGGIAIAPGMTDAEFGNLVLQAHQQGGGVDD